MNNELGDLVRSRRLELGLTQEQLADLVDMSQRWVSTLENGNPRSKGGNVPRAQNMKALASALQLPESRLYVAASIAKTASEADQLSKQLDVEPLDPRYPIYQMLAQIEVDDELAIATLKPIRTLLRELLKAQEIRRLREELQ